MAKMYLIFILLFAVLLLVRLLCVLLPICSSVCIYMHVFALAHTKLERETKSPRIMPEAPFCF